MFLNLCKKVINLRLINYFYNFDLFPGSASNFLNKLVIISMCSGMLDRYHCGRISSKLLHKETRLYFIIDMSLDIRRLWEFQWYCKEKWGDPIYCTTHSVAILKIMQNFIFNNKRMTKKISHCICHFIVNNIFTNHFIRYLNRIYCQNNLAELVYLITDRHEHQLLLNWLLNF